MIKEAIGKIVDKQDLTYDEAYSVIDEILAGKTTVAQNAAFLAALSTKGTKSETEAEIEGCAAAMRARAVPFDHPYKVLDIGGTGGDRSGTFNVSTTSAFVTAAAGVKVAKHGNRAVSSSCGSADVLEALGANIEQSPDTAAALLDDAGICFLYVPRYHPSLANLGDISGELGIRTVFNILGPMTNPAKPAYQLFGVYNELLVMPVAHVLSRLGVQKGMVVYGQDRIDEISCSAPSTICDFEGDDFDVYTVTPEEFGIPRCNKSDVSGGTPQDNARITLDILRGRKSPRYNMTVLNAGAGIYAGKKARDIKDGVELADKLIADGKAMEVFEAFKNGSSE